MCRVNIPNSNFLTQKAYKTRLLLLISTKKHFSGVSLVDVSDIWSPFLPLAEAIKLNLRLLKKRELIALLLLCSVDVMFLLSFFVSSSRCLFNDCCISWLNSLTDSYLIKQNSEYDQELPRSQTEDTPITNSYTYEV